MAMDKSILLDFKTMRKCFHCKEYITLENEMDFVVHYKENIYHEECLKKKLCNKKIGKLCDDDCNKLIENLKKEDRLQLERIIYKNHLYKYLMKHYDIIVLPNYIFTKMEDMFTGNYKDMSKPIPPEHFLDMFQRRASYLDGLYHKVKLDGVSRVNYDLAVLIGKYNSYLDWISKRENENNTSENYGIERLTTMIPVNISAKNKNEDIFEEGE